MTILKNRVKFNTTTTGTGAITVGSAVSGFRTPAGAGIADGEVFPYSIEDGSAWEVGYATYTASGATFTRTVLESSNSDAAINLSGSAVVMLSPLDEQFLQKSAEMLISSETLSGTGSFADVRIPEGFREIKVIIRARTADAGATDRLGLRLGNGASLDTGSNYQYSTYWQGSSTSGSQSAAATYISSSVVPGNGAGSSIFGDVEFRIFLPDDTAQYKNVSQVSGNPDNTNHRTGHGTGVWKNSGKVGVLNILGVATSTFVSGSRMDVIGVTALSDTSRQGSIWKQIIDEDGSSFSNFTSQSGTWSSASGVIKQTDTTAVSRKAYYNTKHPISALIFEAEMQLKNTGTDRQVGLVLGMDTTTSAGSLSVKLREGNDDIDVERDSQAVDLSISTTIAVDTWYKLRLLLMGDIVSIWLDGTFIQSVRVTANYGDIPYLGLTTYQNEGWFRNIKSWILKPPEDAGALGSEYYFQDADLELWVNSTKITLHSESVSRYRVQGNMCQIKAVLAAGSGQSQNGVIEIRNLPHAPVGVSAKVGVSILGMAEERNTGVEFIQSRVYYQATDNLRLRRYPSYTDSSWSVVGDATFGSADMIVLDISYEI